ncbi:sensor histidine kinase [Cellulomonas hominis]
MPTLVPRPARSPAAGRRLGWRFAVLAAAVAALGLVEAVRQATGTAELTVGLVAAVAIGASLLLCGRRPLLALGLTLAITTAATLASGPVPVALFLGVEVAVYQLATRATRPVTVGAAVVTGLVLFWLARGPVEGPITEPAALIVLVWTAFAASFGHAVHNRRDYVQALADRAQRAEETREAVARARVTEERVRIARELHDVVAHHLTVVSLHAGLAGRSVRTAPDVAEESLGHVQASARTALDELGAVLQVLRSDRLEQDDRPMPGTADIGELVASFVSTGLAVRLSVRGAPAPLDPVCDLTVYRVVQESLTNAHKHGTGRRAQVELDHRPDGVDLLVTNSAPWPVPAEGGGPGTGYGLAGMRERVAAVGGTLATGVHPDGTYRVVAHVPATPAAPAAPAAPAPSAAPEAGAR